MRMKRYIQVATFSAGLIHLLTALTMFTVPYWFFENVGQFPPFNRHYMGDLAAFILPLAIGLLVAARDPVRHRMVIAIAAAANLIHTFNHAYDAVIVQTFNHAYDPIIEYTTPAIYWVLEFVPLTLLVVVLITAYTQSAVTRHPIGKGEHYGTARGLY